MNSIVRYFVSQKFGRAAGTVFMDADRKGVVEIAFLESTTAPRQFRFSIETCQHLSDGCDFHESMLRGAISRLHREAKHKQDFCSVVDLSPGDVMWIGDFTIEPFSGGTLGSRMPTPGTAERRCEGAALSLVVDAGARIGESQGRQAGRMYLECAGVPPSVIRRVLSGSRAKRKKASMEPIPDQRGDIELPPQDGTGH